MPRRSWRSSPGLRGVAAPPPCAQRSQGGARCPGTGSRPRLPAAMLWVALSLRGTREQRKSPSATPPSSFFMGHHHQTELEHPLAYCICESGLSVCLGLEDG